MLTSEESASLSAAITNMNIASATVQEVLELVRNLGNSGVVDIATHNNATTAHAAATNLCKIDTSNSRALASGITFPGSAVASLGNSNGGYISKPGNNSGLDATVYCDATQPSMMWRIYANLLDSNGDLCDPANWDGTGWYIDQKVLRLVTSTAGTISQGYTFGIANATNKAANSLAGAWRMTLINDANSSGVTYEFTSQHLCPYGDHTISLGRSAWPFDTAYFRTAATITSDRREKSNIEALDSKAEKFVMALRPVQFTVNTGKSVATASDENNNPTAYDVTPGARPHWGFVAQDVKTAMAAAGYEDAAVWSLADKNDPDSKQALRYEELIAPMIKVIQRQQERIEALERRLA